MSIFFPSFIGCTGVSAVRKWKSRQLVWPSKREVPLFLLGAMFLLGGILGCCFANLLDGDGAQALSEYLNDYVALAMEDGIQPGFWSLLGGRLGLLAAAVLFGLTAIGVVGFPILFGVRGFFLAYSVACFSRLLGTAGMIPGLILFGLPALLWMPALFLLGIQGMDGAWTMLRRGLGESRCPLPYSSVYWVRVALCAGAMLLCVLLEYMVVPVLLRGAVRVFL